MDKITAKIASYAGAIKYEDLPPEVIHKTKGLLIDALGCGIGGYPSDPARIARKMAERVQEKVLPATILGTGKQSTPELATFANGVMIRYLDFNDGYVSKSRGHPSDNFAPVLTCGAAMHASGKELLAASVLSYEVFGRVSDQIDLNLTDFDHAVTGVISSVAGASKILRLSQEQMVEAINLAIAPNISLLQTRAGELSMWKCCAFANAAKNAVFASLLAKEGMTGPRPIFEGRHGFFHAISGPFELEEWGGKGNPFRIMNVSIKRYPLGQHAQTAVDAALKVRSKISRADEIAGVRVGTFKVGKTVMGEEPEKWRPQTRETADHSIPYAVGAALFVGGPVEIRHFSSEYLHHPDLLSLIQKIKVEESEECNNLFPAISANRVTVITKTGQTFSEMVQYHRGHYMNPLTDTEIEQKFNSLTQDLLRPSRRENLLRLLWNLEQVADVHEIMELLKVQVKG
jgi:2-methylcitrate dehydratase